MKKNILYLEFLKYLRDKMRLFLQKSFSHQKEDNIQPQCLYENYMKINQNCTKQDNNVFNFHCVKNKRLFFAVSVL